MASISADDSESCSSCATERDTPVHNEDIGRALQGNTSTEGGFIEASDMFNNLVEQNSIEETENTEVEARTDAESDNVTQTMGRNLEDDAYSQREMPENHLNIDSIITHQKSGLMSLKKVSHPLSRKIVSEKITGRLLLKIRWAWLRQRHLRECKRGLLKKHRPLSHSSHTSKKKGRIKLKEEYFFS